MALLKSPEDIVLLRQAGKKLALIVEELTRAVRPGVSTVYLDSLAERLMRAEGGEPALLGYTPEGATRPFPATLCVALNSEVVHGIPAEPERFLKEGDIIGLDTVIKYQGLFIDMAVTLPVGVVDALAQKLMDTTKQALQEAIWVCRPGKRVHDIGCAIEKYVRSQGFSVVEDLGGHAVGHAVHEFPYIPNYCDKSPSLELKPGMLLALEPIVTEGSSKVVLDEKDGYTYRTLDGRRSAHFEHSVLITEGEPEILTLA